MVGIMLANFKAGENMQFMSSCLTLKKFITLPVDFVTTLSISVSVGIFMGTESPLEEMAVELPNDRV